MKIEFEKHLKRDSLLCHLVCHCMGSAAEEIAKDFHIDKTLDITLTVNGHELPIEGFCEHWQSQVERMLKEEANNLIKDKFSEIDDLFLTVRKAISKKLHIDISEEGE